ncbi:hypothetical protein [Mesomycoplasma lagogenitalium]|uniref:Uncharacterized protein n=1 Tax=Mesomycoplasma lagogenitalium TaxID=171286 RepID=A0ABY8LSL2_9BACT|nr:hypothetical protein [Mesomycoplasma lagogenitalium]WGI36254.1 hypothetical protein QEG99_02120 [Mesomycoplasma lagogenitalium]
MFSFISVSFSFLNKVAIANGISKNKGKGNKKSKILFLFNIILGMFLVLFHGLILITIIFINKSFSIDKNIYAFWPINIISYIIGISLIVPSILINLILNNIKERKRNGQRQFFI